MKKLLFVLSLFICLKSFSEVDPKKKNLKKIENNLTWRGKKITSKALEDSLRVTFFKNCDCVNTKTKKIKQSS